MYITKGVAELRRSLRVPQRGQHSPSDTVALAHGIRGQEILRHTVAEFWAKEELNWYKNNKGAGWSTGYW